MSIQLQCPCHQKLSVPENAIGKNVRCPKCQTLLRVPAVARPVQAEPDPLANLSVDIPPPTYHRPSYQSTSAYSGVPRQSAAKRDFSARGAGFAFVIGFLGTAACAVLVIAVWTVLPMLSRPKPIEDSFTPVAATTSQPAPTPATDAAPITESFAAVPMADNPASPIENAPASPTENFTSVPTGNRTPRESAMLSVADKFVRHARQNEVREAIALIDKSLFHARVYSGKGSYEAMTRDISTAELLKNIACYALDGAPVGGHRHWQVIGLSQFEEQPGVVLRYYVEHQSPMEALTQSKLFDRLGAVIKYEQLVEKAGKLFTRDGQNGTHFDRYELRSHAIHNVRPARAGYMMLVFNWDETDPKLIDVVNVLGQSPLSRTAAHVFLSDYHTFGGRGSRETYGTYATTMTVYGLSANTLGAYWNANEPGAEERARQKIAAATAAEEQKRPKRLEKLVELWSHGDANLPNELARFHKDFPNDLGFEMGIVFEKMRAKQPKFTSPHDELVVKAAKALYQQWRDPFFQYVEALALWQTGHRAEAEALFARCVAAGFAPADYAIMRIEAALDRSDTPGILAALEQWQSTLPDDGLSPNKDMLDKLAHRYQVLEQVLNPQPSLSEMMSSPRDPFANRRSRFGMDSSGGDPSGRFPMGPPPGFGQPPPGFGQPPPGFGQPPPGFGSAPTPRPAAPSGPQVTIKITSGHAFDGVAMTQKLVAALSVTNHNFMQSGQTATLTMTFDRTLQEIVDAIDFGKVTNKDELTRTIEVTIP